MKKTNLAKNFITVFCAGDIDTLELLLCEDFKFSGPLFKGNRQEYIDELKKNPPEICEFDIINIYEIDGGVSILYNYKKKAGSLKIEQMFKFKEDKISKIEIVFDTSKFKAL